MRKCPICKVNYADKKNVHLIPWFLIKNTVTKDGFGERDTEISFSIEPQNFTKLYTGRSIIPESVERLGVLEDFQKEKDNPYSKDNIVCAECEEKFSRLEAIFAFQFSNKRLINAAQSKLPSINKNQILIDEKYDSSLYELLIQSIFYRCSIGRFNGFRLNNQIENKIEENLRQVFIMMKDLKKIKNTETIDFLYKFPIITSCFFIPTEQDTTKTFIVVNNSRFPYFLMAGKWMFELFETQKHLKSSVEWLYGLQRRIKPFETYNLVKNTSHVILLDTENGEAITKNLVDYFVEKKIL